MTTSVESLFEPPHAGSARQFATDQNKVTVTQGRFQISFDLNNYRVTVFGGFPEGTSAKVQTSVLKYLKQNEADREALSTFLTRKLELLLDKDRTITSFTEIDSDDEENPICTSA